MQRGQMRVAFHCSVLKLPCATVVKTCTLHCSNLFKVIPGSSLTFSVPQPALCAGSSCVLAGPAALTSDYAMQTGHLRCL